MPGAGCDDNHQGPDSSSDNHCGQLGHTHGLGRMARAEWRRDGFSAVEAGYQFWDGPLDDWPLARFVTVELKVPTPDSLSSHPSAEKVFLAVNLQTSVVGFVRVGLVANNVCAECP